MHDFSNLIEKYSTVIRVFTEKDGVYNYEKGGAWEADTEPTEVKAAVFNMTSRDINSAIQYNGGGAYTKGDIKIYTYERLPIGAKITHKNSRYTVSTEADYSDFSNGLRIYIAKGAGELNGAN